MAHQVGGERVLRQTQPADRAVVRSRQEGRHRDRQPQRLPEDILAVVAMAGREQRTERLQVLGPHHRDAGRRVHHRREDGEICLVSATREKDGFRTSRNSVPFGFGYFTNIRVHVCVKFGVF